MVWPTTSTSLHWEYFCLVPQVSISLNNVEPTMQNIVLNKASFCPSRPFFGENPGVVNIFHVRNLGPCQSMQTQDSEELENKIHKRSMSAFISFEKCITDISVSCILEQTVSQSINCKFFTDCFSSNSYRYFRGLAESRNSG